MSPLIPTAPPPPPRLPEPWRRAKPLFVCTAECRSLEHLHLAARQWDVERAARYQRRPGKTFCNIFLWDVTQALDCEIPHEHPCFGSEVVPGYETWAELNATGAILWLRRFGPAHGWTECTEASARARANAGMPTVATWTNPDAHHSSHVALVLPSPEGGPLHIAQAGLFNLYDVPIARGFGSFEPIVFFTHP